jgi:hypothetical protein
LLLEGAQQTQLSAISPDFQLLESAAVRDRQQSLWPDLFHALTNPESHSLAILPSLAFQGNVEIVQEGFLF